MSLWIGGLVLIAAGSFGYVVALTIKYEGTGIPPVPLGVAGIICFGATSMLILMWSSSYFVN